MNGKHDERKSDDRDSNQRPPQSCSSGVPACPVCGGELIDIRGKLQCTRCHRNCETCCEGKRSWKSEG